MALVVTLSTDEHRWGDLDTPIILIASGATGLVRWTTSAGTLSALTGPETRLYTLNRTDVVTITAEDDTDTIEKVVQIWGTLPVQPKWAVEADFNNSIASWPMAYERRKFEEYWRVLQFWKWHGSAVLEISPAEDDSIKVRVLRGKPFFINDLALGHVMKVFFDSSIRVAAQGHVNFISYSFQLKGFSYDLPSAPETGFFAGVEFGDFMEVGAPTVYRILFSDSIFKSALMTVTKTLFTLGPNEYVTTVSIRPVSGFAGSGIATINVSVGSSTASNGGYYAPPTDITDAGTSYEIVGVSRDDSNSEILLTFTADSDFGDGSATFLTVGVVEVIVTTETIV